MKYAIISGRTSLDFAATRKWRRRHTPEELLIAPDCLSDWAQQAGLLDGPMDVSPGDLVDAVELREAIYRTVAARLLGNGPCPADVMLLNERAQRPVLRPLLLPTGDVRREGTCAELTATLAWDAVDLLASKDIQRTKTCADANCTRMYVDSSRGSSRQWCGMGGCGNRAKVKAFRARQRAGDVPNRDR